MSWQSAKIDSDRHLAFILKKIDELKMTIKNLGIKFTDYENENCYFLLKGEGPNVWTLKHHRMVNELLRQKLTSMGAKTEIVTIKLSEYWSWLEENKLPNTTANRARFIGVKSAVCIKC